MVKNNKIVKVKKSVGINPYLLCVFFALGIVFKAFFASHIILYLFIFFIIYSAIVKRNMKLIINRDIMFVFFMIVIYGIFLVMHDVSFSTIRSFAVQTISLGLLVLLLKCKMEINDLKILSKLVRILFIGFIIIFGIQYIRGRVTGDGKTFAFGIYQMVYALSIFVLFNTSHKAIYTLLLTGVCFLSGDRGDAISIVVVYLSYLFINNLKFNYKVYNAFYWIVSIVSCSFSFFYLWLFNSSYATIVNAYTIKYTHANFFSGRNIIWKEAQKLIMQHPIIGNGFSTMAFDSGNTDVKMSAHNTYMQLLVSGGIILTALVLIMLFLIWRQYYWYLDYEIAKISAAALIGCLIISTNIVVMVGTDIQTSIYMYFGMTMGIMAFNCEKYKDIPININ